MCGLGTRENLNSCILMAIFHFIFIPVPDLFLRNVLFYFFRNVLHRSKNHSDMKGLPNLSDELVFCLQIPDNLADI